MWSTYLLWGWLFLLPVDSYDRFEKPCAFLGDLKGNPHVECGQITVPEDHLSNEGTIHITYVVLKAKNPQGAHPLIYFTGGPGGATLTKDALRRWFDSPFRENRDLVLFDQRGINHSSALPNMERDIFEVMASDADINKEQHLVAQVMQRYQQKTEDQGINVANYNSFQNAHDVGALMKHLSYERYNLMGGSYGTRLARVVQDLYPQFVHSVVLNSPNPLGDDFLISRLQSFSLALSRIFDYCEQQPECRAQYPDLRTDYIEAIQALKNQPYTVSINDQSFVVNAQDAIYLLRRALYGTNSRSTAPALIQAFKNRTPEAIEDVLSMELDLIGAYNSTMWISVERHEMFNPKFVAAVVDSVYTTLPLFPEKLGMFTSIYLELEDWHQNLLPLDQRTFKPSAIPTLIFVNRYDPVTPPINGKIMQEQLSNSQLFVMDEGGHGGGDLSCRLKVISDFMDAPNDILDTSCLNLYHE